MNEEYLTHEEMLEIAEQRENNNHEEIKQSDVPVKKVELDSWHDTQLDL